MSDLRDRIARALFLVDYGHQAADAWEASRLDGNSDRPHAYSQADAVLAVLDKVRAEAWDEGFDAGQAWESDMNSRVIPSASRQDNPYRKADR